MSNAFHGILYPGFGHGADDSTYPFSLVEGVITVVSADGVTFTVPTWDGGEQFKHGPAPYAGWTATSVSSGGITTTTATHGPQVGDRCLVAFLGTGQENPWVIGWWPS